MQARVRYPLIALAMLALLAAGWAGLVRIGWRWPALQPGLLLAHGPLMISGFLGTLIALERAVALRDHRAYLGPALTGSLRPEAVGGLLLVLGAPSPAAPLLIALGSLSLVVVLAGIVRRQPALHSATMAMGALAWLIGNLAWLAGWPVFRIVRW